MFPEKYNICLLPRMPIVSCGIAPLSTHGTKGERNIEVFQTLAEKSVAFEYCDESMRFRIGDKCRNSCYIFR